MVIFCQVFQGSNFGKTIEALNIDSSKLPRVRSKINKFIITAENILKTKEKVPLNHIFVLDRPTKYTKNRTSIFLQLNLNKLLFVSQK